MARHLQRSVAMPSLPMALVQLGEPAGEGSAARLDRQVVVFGGALMSLGGLVWGFLAVSQNLVAAAAIPFGYGVITAINFAVLAATRRLEGPKVVQVLISLLLPFAFQWALGGFVKSGGVMLWAMIALVASLTFSTARASLLWLLTYCVLTLLSGVLDSRLSAAASSNPSAGVITLFFVLNVVFISTIVFGLAIALTVRQRRAILELEAEQVVSRELAAQVEASVVIREDDIANLRRTEEALRELSAGLAARVDEKTAELRAALDRAEEATRAKSGFLATMSHEIRTPLNGILATTDLLQTTPLDPLQTQSLLVVRRSGEMLLTILNDVLDFSRIEAGKLELVSRPFDPRAELEAVVALHRPVAARNGVVIRLNVRAPFPPTLRGDADRLSQVIGNLLGNSVKFTHSGSITVDADAVDEGELVRLRVSIADTGIGIPAADLPRLFQAFTQVDSSMTRRYGGSGLGLSICARLVEKLGGSITAQSEEGAGTTLSFDVRMHRAEGSLVAHRPGGPLFISDARVLLVEDNAINQLVAKGLLERLSCAVEVVGDGLAAVERVRSSHFDLVLMDLQMPGLDGFEATRAIRALPLARQPRIVALTANAFDSDVRACREAGMDDFLSKPLRLDGLSRVLEVLLPVRRAS